jgi:hypothetical protein
MIQDSCGTDEYAEEFTKVFRPGAKPVILKGRLTRWTGNCEEIVVKEVICGRYHQD